MTYERITGKWMSTDPTDVFNQEIKLNDQIVRACKSGQAVNIEICTVTRVENEKIYVDFSKVAIRYPGRCMIVNAVVRDVYKKEGI